MVPSPSRLRVWVDRLVDRGSDEGGEATCMTFRLALHVGSLLAAYYVIKPVREELILAAPHGAEFKAAATGLSALLLLMLMPLYDRLVLRWSRTRLLVVVTGAFVLSLAVFYGLCQWPPLRGLLGIPFYLWCSVFNMVTVTHFWALASEAGSVSHGERMFAVLGLGQSLGAVFGSQLATRLVAPDGRFGGVQVPTLLLLGALLLLLSACIGLSSARALDRNGRVQASRSGPLPQGAFALVRSHRFLRLLAGLGLLVTLVNSNGEYLLSKTLLQDLSALSPEARKGHVAGFFGQFYFEVSLCGLLIQALLVGRLMRPSGLRFSLMAFPLVAMAGSCAFVVVPVLQLLRVTKTAENAIDYSLNSTGRHVLWLPMPAEVKYKAKQFVDTLIVRVGDLAASALVLLGGALLGLFGWSAHALQVLSGCNALLCLGWWWLAREVVREYRRLAITSARAPPQQEAPIQAQSSVAKNGAERDGHSWVA